MNRFRAFTSIGGRRYCNTSWTRWCIMLIVVWPLVAYFVDHVMNEAPPTSKETQPAVMEKWQPTKERWITDHTNPYYMTDVLTQRARPLLLTDTPYNKWSIWSWSFDSLADNVELVLAKRSSHKVIKYFSTSQLVMSKPLQRPYKEILFPAKKLFEKLTAQSDGHYYYASGGIELLGFKGRDVYSKESLREMTFRSHQSLGQVNFWIGAGNVTAHTHYDTSHNLHVVISGKKKFLLWPPSAYESLILYPCLHHYYRQTYYTYTDLPSTIPTPIEVHWHAWSPSISISVWSYGLEITVYSDSNNLVMCVVIITVTGLILSLSWRKYIKLLFHLKNTGVMSN